MAVADDDADGTPSPPLPAPVLFSVATSPISTSSSARELRPELGGLESASSPVRSGLWSSPGSSGARTAASNSALAHACRLSVLPPSTLTSPCSMPRPRIVPAYLESWSDRLCFFFSAVGERRGELVSLQAHHSPKLKNDKQ